MKYSQNNEGEIIEKHFGQFVGTLLSIGENDGITLSNVFPLIPKGWGADLVECSPQVFPNLSNLHEYNDQVFCHNLAIGDRDGRVTLYDSGELLGKGDRALVSSTIRSETNRWQPLNIPFKEEVVEMRTFQTFMEESAHYKTYDLISVDAEGFDLIILRQMDLDVLGCKCLVIEHNSLPAVVANIREYCQPYGLKQIGYNQENIILAAV